MIHTRHISPRSPYLAEGDWWIDALAAHPVDPTFFRRWFDDARRWGACAIEQDWMLMYWFGVRALRAAPDRAADWQRTLDALAAESGVGLIWCMATPADLVLAATLDHVVAVRTSDDYRFAADPALLWTWYLTVNRVAGASELPAFKDCFFSGRPPDGGDAIDGDEHAELEALLACMSAGPGRHRRPGRVHRPARWSCAPATTTVASATSTGRSRSSTPACSASRRAANASPGPRPRRPAAADAWTYVVAVNTSTDRRVLADELALADIGVAGPAAVYDWRRGSVDDGRSLTVELAPRDWALWVCAPPGERADAGDLRKYVTVAADLA